jgi:hypothetical protein
VKGERLASEDAVERSPGRPFTFHLSPFTFHLLVRRMRENVNLELASPKRVGTGFGEEIVQEIA